jgi:hypothetical protein
MILRKLQAIGINCSQKALDTTPSIALCALTGNTDGFTLALPLSAMATERPSRFTESCRYDRPESGGTCSPTIRAAVAKDNGRGSFNLVFERA